MVKMMEGFKKIAKKLDISLGDILCVSSDIKKLLYVAYVEGFNTKKKQNEIFDSLINELQGAVGTEGTLLFPIFTWTFCKNKEFDIRKTKGETGTLANWILENRPDFVRTKHPMYSFMVWGKYAEQLRNMDNQDAWGEASIFQFLKEKKGKQLLFDIDANQGLTFCHYVEQCADVPYRHPKYFFGNYIDEKGKKEFRMYSMYVRDINVKMEVGVKNSYLIEKEVAKQDIWKENVLTVVDLSACWEVLWSDITKNHGKNSLLFEQYIFDMNNVRNVQYEINL